MNKTGDIWNGARTSVAIHPIITRSTRYEINLLPGEATENLCACLLREKWGVDGCVDLTA